jgi:hypothetical protein
LGSAVIPDVDHDMVAEPPVTQRCARRYGEFGLTGTTSDTKYIMRDAGCRTDCHVANEPNHDLLALLRDLIVGPCRQIEHHASVAVMAADPHRHWRPGICQNARKWQPR